jgi:hypothetical protein
VKIFFKNAWEDLSLVLTILSRPDFYNSLTHFFKAMETACSYGATHPINGKQLADVLSTN